MNQIDIPNFLYDDNKRAKYKIRYTPLCGGDYIYVSGGRHLAVSHVGKFVSVLTLDSVFYIAYSVPEVQVESEVPYIFYQQWKVKRVVSPKLYIAPMSTFICRLNCYVFDDTHDAIIPRYAQRLCQNSILINMLMFRL